MPRPEVRIAAKFLVPLVAGGLLFLTGCPGETPQTTKTGTAAKAKPDGDEDHDHDHAHHHHHHAEKGPHSGALVAIGEDDAHIEIVLDAETGKLTAYVLDGAAEKAVAVKQKNLQLAITLEHDHNEKGHDEKDEKKDELPDAVITLMLAAVSPGEDGTASEFAGQSDELKGAKEFEAALTSVTVGDKPFTDVKFKYPEGNEHDHHH
jgi:hypothetical protein